MSFGLGLATGLAKGVDAGLQKSMERMRDQIDETAKYGLAFKARQLEKDMAKEEDVMEALTNSVEVFGGGEAGKARAVAMLKQYGDIDSFNSFVGDLKTRMRDDPESFKVDSYFGQYDGKEPIELLQASRAYVDKRKIDDKPIPTMPIRGGGLLKTIFGTDVEDRAGQRVDERISTNLSAMGLTPRERVSEFPTADIDFRGEQFKLDGMTAKEQVDYITNKIPTLEVGSDRYISLTSQLSKVTNNLGGEAKRDEYVRRYNAGETNLLSEIQELNRTINANNILMGGDATEIAQLEFKNAIESNDADRIQKASNKLVDLGVMTLADVMQQAEDRALQAVTIATTPEEKASAEKALASVKTNNQLMADAKKLVAPDEPIDMTLVRSYAITMEELVDKKIAEDPRAQKYVIFSETTGTLSISSLFKDDANAVKVINELRAEYNSSFINNLEETQKTQPEFEFFKEFYGKGGTLPDSSTITKDKDGNIVTSVDFPNTADGARAMIAKGTEQGALLNVDVVNYIRENKSPEFAKVVVEEFMRQQTKEGLGATQAAYEEAAFPDEEAVNTLKLDNVVDRIYDLPLIDRKIMGDKTLINLIMEELNITNDKATALVPKVKAMIKQKDTGLNTGGLMSRR